MSTPETPEEELAKGLARKVEEEAEAVTGRVEERARKLEERRSETAATLEEQRVEHRVEERIEQRTDLKEELHGVVTSIGLLIQHMDQSLPEERIQKLADAVLAEERLGRKRLTTKITGFLVVILLVVFTSLIQARANGEQNDRILTVSKDAKVTSDYVQNCVQHPQNLTPEQRVVFCGPTPAGTTNFIKYLNCVLLILPEDRTDTKLTACAAAAFGN